ncbi:MAG TPA: recombinase family protein [Puia sp.]|jgi:DNA invertase Pin-like site-specific DNA recombinase
MKTADLYIRVSTDEQADKGYSQRNQEEVLKKYCELHRIAVKRVVFEDHSAKTFNRPRWQSLLSELRRHKGQTDLILFTKWDRFSRNAGDAYQMISTLRRLGVEPQAIEQSLDLSVPENKMMLAFYLAAPEVENDRRALNTLHGMRRARKEGRWMGPALLGYANKVSEDGKKYIAPKEPEASIIKWAFNEVLAAGKESILSIWQSARKKGLPCGRSNFWMLLRNPTYCGKIFVGKFKEEESQWVKGQHEPLIPEYLFYQVRDVLDGKKRIYAPKKRTQDYPMRGFLICPDCGRLLTGSSSQGRSKKYFYYHCKLPCKSRFHTDQTHDLFARELQKFIPRAGMSQVYTEVITRLYHSQTKGQQEGLKAIRQELEQVNGRLVKARNRLIDDELDAADYKAVKNECERKIEELESRLMNTNTGDGNIGALLQKAIEALSHLEQLWEEATAEKKRLIIGSIYPEKLVFDGKRFQTARLNEGVRLIYTLNEGLAKNEKGQREDISALSSSVTPSGLSPAPAGRLR